MTTILNIRDEEVLLTRLCRLEFSDDQVKKIGTLSEIITDWNYFGLLANSHGVAALVYHNLEKLKLLSFVPEEIAALLRNGLMKSLSRNAFNSETMEEVLKLLKSENIKTVLLKGMALELSVYDNEGIRQMTDVDILISRDKCMKARKILMDNGFVSLPVKSIFYNFILADLGKHLPSLIKNGTSVEIHHELFGGRGTMLTRMLIETSYELRLKGEKVFIPQPQLFFLYLVKHLYLHEINNESQLRLYTDLVVLIEKHRDRVINYDLLEYASQADLSEILACRLELLRDIWGVDFPSWIDDLIDRWHDPRSIDKFAFFLKSPKDNSPLNKAWLYRNAIREIPGIHRKFIFIVGDIFPTIKFMKERYNCNSGLKVLLYYPYRLGKILYLLKK
jgi:hypothetical protein